MQYEDVIKRLKAYFRVTTDKDLGENLNMTPQTLFGRSHRRSIPYKEIVESLRDTYADLNTIFYGTNKSEVCSTMISNVRFYDDDANTDVNGNMNCSSACRNIHIDPLFLPETLTGNIAAFKIQNESMGDTLKKGDIIFIDLSQTNVIDGSIHIVNVNGHNMIRRLFNLSGKIILSSDNGNFPNYDLSPSEVTVIGRVICKKTEL